MCRYAFSTKARPFLPHFIHFGGYTTRLSSLSLFCGSCASIRELMKPFVFRMIAFTEYFISKFCSGVDLRAFLTTFHTQSTAFSQESHQTHTHTHAYERDTHTYTKDQAIKQQAEAYTHTCRRKLHIRRCTLSMMRSMPGVPLLLNVITSR